MADAASRLSGTESTRRVLRTLKRKLQRAMQKAAVDMMRLATDECIKESSSGIIQSRHTSLHMQA